MFGFKCSMHSSVCPDIICSASSWQKWRPGPTCASWTYTSNIIILEHRENSGPDNRWWCKKMQKNRNSDHRWPSLTIVDHRWPSPKHACDVSVQVLESTAPEGRVQVSRVTSPAPVVKQGEISWNLLKCQSALAASSSKNPEMYLVYILFAASLTPITHR